MSAKQSVVIGMATDPKPHQTVDGFYRKCPMVRSNPSGPEAAHLLEMKRWMVWIVLQVGVGAIGEPLNFPGQRSVADPESG